MSLLGKNNIDTPISLAHVPDLGGREAAGLAGLRPMGAAAGL